MRRRPGILAAAAALTVVLFTGCERRAQDRPAPDAPAAALRVTADFGRVPLLARPVAADQPVMRALRGAVTVSTAYGGDFVSRMFGRVSDPEARRDWFYFVNGVEGDVGAKGYRLSRGETAWWDFRSWRGQLSVPAVVGLWPEPFVHGFRGRPGGVAADAPLDRALRAAGVRIVSGSTPWRVRVGADVALRARDGAWRRAVRDPGRAGLTATIEAGRVTALDARGERRMPVAGARAVAVAFRSGVAGPDGVVLAVVGLDAAAARAAAARIARDPGVLANRYALTFDGRGRPMRAAGRPGP